MADTLLEQVRAMRADFEMIRNAMESDEHPDAEELAIAWLSAEHGVKVANSLELDLILSEVIA